MHKRVHKHVHFAGDGSLLLAVGGTIGASLEGGRGEGAHGFVKAGIPSFYAIFSQPCSRSSCPKIAIIQRLLVGNPQTTLMIP